MREVLKLHPDSRCAAVTCIEVAAARPHAGTLRLIYRVSGSISNLAIPPLATPVRTDELWRHTCFEAFVRPEPGEAYEEFNFAPSARWAAYRFDAYRSGMRVAAWTTAPRIAVEATPACFILQAELELGAAADGAGRLGLAAVIEERSGRLSYWALAHPSGRPDFHHAGGFVAALP